MNLLKYLFGQSDKNNQPSEPIFPGERFSISKLTFPDSWGLVTFNTKYNDYPNKSFPVACINGVGNYQQKGQRASCGHRRGKIVKLEDEILEFLKHNHTIHYLGRVTRNGFRDLLHYIDTPTFEQTEVNIFCDKVMKERAINFGMEKDPKWTAVSGFIKKNTADYN